MPLKILTKISIVFFYASVIFLPFFNDFPFFGSTSLLRNPSTLFLLLAGFFSGARMFCENRFNLDNRIAVFVLLILLSTLFNLPAALYLNSHSVTGIELIFKASTLYILLLCGSQFLGATLNTTRFELVKLRKLIIISLFISIPYNLIEVAYIFSMGDFIPDLKYGLDSYFHLRNGEDYQELRVRGFSFEASFFAIYLSFAFPWALSYLADKRTIVSFILVTLLVVFLILSASRTGYVITLVQAIIFILINQYRQSIRNIIIIIVCGYLILQLFNIGEYGEVFNSLFSSTNNSNLERVGAQHAAFILGLDNPFFGVGPGLSGAYLTDYYPNYMLDSETINTWLGEGHRALAAPTFGLLAGITAELGFVAFFYFIYCIAYVFYNIFKKYICIAKKNSDKSTLLLALIISFIGVFMSSFVLQGAVFAGYWICLTLFIFIKNEYSKKSD